MISIHLQEHRCENCHRLFFKGFVGLGFVEVKCSRCGHISILNSFDTLLSSKSDTYIIVYDSKGNVIVASRTAAKTLGYSREDLDAGVNIQNIDPLIGLPEIPEKPKLEDLKIWEFGHENLGPIATHIGKNGQSINARAQYYPIASNSRMYTIGVFSIVK